MEEAEIYRKLTSIFNEIFDEESIVVRPDLTAHDVDEWDSLNHIRLILTAEKEFQVRFSASEIGKLQNVGEFVELIRRKQAEAERRLVYGS
jgi:acyl carrier protein